MQGCGDSPFGKVLAAQARGPGFDSLHLYKNTSLVVLTCDPSTEWVRKGRSLGFPGHQPYLSGSQVPVRDPTSKSKVGSFCTHMNICTFAHVHTHAHTCTHMSNTCTHVHTQNNSFNKKDRHVGPQFPLVQNETKDKTSVSK